MMNDTSTDDPVNGFQILITLKNISPSIWRRVVVPADISLEMFHNIIQIAMGWDDYHSYLFKKGDARYLMPDEEDELEEGEFDESDFILSDLLIAEGDKIEYIYDFGDYWEHEIALEEILEESPGEPICLDGKRACPPEDVGGAQGYMEFLQAMKDPKHPKHQEYVDEFGDEFDAEEFDLELCNEMFEDFAE